jgi:hypothetical protein
MALVRWDGVATILLIFSVLLTSVGGLLDITENTKFGCITKQHLWHDGMYILLLLIVYLLANE